uniref:Predicted protein n=1 Tax=Hordeum vulgare subsp. vulgare TaxID=112509 RepID=F2D5L1_HORVV|nr:predicted protein [Hordeum vulgare subsp. vulgare]
MAFIIPDHVMQGAPPSPPPPTSKKQSCCLEHLGPFAIITTTFSSFLQHLLPRRGGRGCYSS